MWHWIAVVTWRYNLSPNADVQPSANCWQLTSCRDARDGSVALKSTSEGTSRTVVEVWIHARVFTDNNVRAGALERFRADGFLVVLVIEW